MLLSKQIVLAVKRKLSSSPISANRKRVPGNNLAAITSICRLTMASDLHVACHFQYIVCFYRAYFCYLGTAFFDYSLISQLPAPFFIFRMTIKTLIIDDIFKDWFHKTRLAFTFVGLLFSVYYFRCFDVIISFNTAISLYSIYNNDIVLPSSDNCIYTRVHNNFL